MKRSRLNPVSKRKRLQIQDEKAVRDAYRQAHPYCEAHNHSWCSFPDEIPCECWGDLQVHEPWQRSQGGPTDDPRNLRVVCANSNRLISQNVIVRNWALFHGFSTKRARAVEWLEGERHQCQNPQCPFTEGQAHGAVGVGNGEADDGEQQEQRDRHAG